MKFFKLFILILISSQIHAQKLPGKWLMYTPGDTYMIPAVPIFEFQNDSITTYNFDEIYSQAPYRVENDILYTSNNRMGRIRFITENELVCSLENGGDFHWTRIRPTETNLSEEALAELQFKLKTNESKKEILVDLGEQNSENDGFRLERIGDSYFLSFYKRKKRSKVLFIQKVTYSEIVLAGYPGQPEMTAQLITE
ncbi:hypothetical protein [Christiangramia flava]|uniref:Uncharacterized protein n=1 Tax=Christiangramia flava JLT2011 TaxID=1229726 RepID=A0A1L7I7B9_9FLAO|nr:hypothetical protein [Christiangramia flava]APU69508.1 hypothetical protein GRFL_2784 [Christiangramia flava JLT2011]OSS37890.1 hypothetical protein C723_3169 [Christiangramia flava JLT2011]